MDEKKDIQSMNIEELRAELHEVSSTLREREEDIHVLQMEVDKITKERDQYKGWWTESEGDKEKLKGKLTALKSIVNAI